MYTDNIDMRALFDQLGLESSAAAIECFCAQNKLPDGLPLHQAAFWSESQARFLREEIACDAAYSAALQHDGRLRCGLGTDCGRTQCAAARRAGGYRFLPDLMAAGTPTRVRFVHGAAASAKRGRQRVAVLRQCAAAMARQASAQARQALAQAWQCSMSLRAHSAPQASHTWAHSSHSAAACWRTRSPSWR